MSKEFNRGDRVFAIVNKKVVDCTVLRQAKTDPLGEVHYCIEVGVRHKPIVRASRLFRDYDEAEEALQRELNFDIWPNELHDMDDRRYWI